VRDEDLAAGLSHLSRHLSGATNAVRPAQE